MFVYSVSEPLVMYREYTIRLSNAKVGKDTPPFRLNEQHGSLPVLGKETRMAAREKLDALSLLREGLQFEGTGASHVFVILGASVSTRLGMCALTCTCIAK